MSGEKILILGTGGTVAGTSESAGDNVGYTAARVGIAELVAGIPALQGLPIETEQLAQLDSKDMDTDTWCRLARRVQQCLADPSVTGVVITHGTDTLEETAYFLEALLAPAKPVVLTCAMRPSTALSPDGPQNLVDAVTVARSPGARGVLAVCAGVVHTAAAVTKVHPYRLDAFSSGDAGPLGWVEEGGVRLASNWPLARSGAAPAAIENIVLARAWPRVEIVLNHAGAGGAVVEALVAQGVAGIVVAGTGNGTVHAALEAALLAAQARGVRVVRASRCVQGVVIAHATDRLPPTARSPVKARIDLQLALLAA